MDKKFLEELTMSTFLQIPQSTVCGKTSRNFLIEGIDISLSALLVVGNTFRNV
jgi:hypothetical protein